MRRTRASAPALAAIGLLLALLASILTAGAASAADQVTIDLRQGPTTVTGSVSATDAIEYVVKAAGGSQFSMELLSFNDPICFSFDPLRLTMTTQAGTFVDSAALRDCTSYGPVTIPAEGVLVVRVDADVASSYQLRFGQVEFEDVATRIRSGTTSFNGTITVALDGVDYVVKAKPGDQVALQNNLGFCNHSTFGAKVMDSAEHELSASMAGDCSILGTWTVPADGIVKIRVLHGAGLLRNNQPNNYDYTVKVLRHTVISLPPRQETVVVTGTIDVPLGGTEYVVSDPADVDGLWIERLSTRPGAECLNDGSAVVLTVEFRLNGSPIGRQPLDCGINAGVPYPPEFWESGLSIRVIGFSNDSSRPSTGRYRLAIHPLRTKRVAVNVTTGPAPVTSSLDLLNDIDEYTVTGRPGQLVVAYDPAPYAPGGACHVEGPGLTVGSNDAGYDPAMGQLSQACGRYGPWRIPDSGTIHVQVGSVVGFKPSAGPYRLTFDTIEYETVPLDLAAGQREVSGRIDVPLDGTDYVVAGEPGQQVQVEVLSLDAPASCEDRMVFPLQLDVFNASWQLVTFQDIGYNGCYLYPPHQIGPDGKLVFRAYLGGSGEGTSGGYTLRFSLVPG